MKLKKKIKKIFKKIRPYIDAKYNKKKKGRIALHNLLKKLKQRSIVIKKKIKSGKLGNTKMQELKQELEIIKLQRKKRSKNSQEGKQIDLRFFINWSPTCPLYVPSQNCYGCDVNISYYFYLSDRAWGSRCYF
jgi:hypothetical protein